MESVYFDGTGYQSASPVGQMQIHRNQNDRFCIAASDDDFAALKTSGLERLAQEFLTVSVHSCLYSIEAKQNNKAEEEVGSTVLPLFSM